MTLTGLSERCPEATLQIVLVDGPTIEQLNREFLGHQGETDVICFDLHDPEYTIPEGDEPVYGEIYICLDVACRAAVSCGTSVDYETVLYAVHGMLHLTGFDDQSSTEKQAMEQRQEEIMALLHDKVRIEGIFRQV